MDLEILEALALADNRADALQQLLAGSEDHDYFRCLHAQHRGALDEAQTVIDSWVDRHGTSDRYHRLRLRQLWYRLGEDPAKVADDVRDQFDVSHWHETDAPEVDPSRPTQLASGAFAFDGATLLEQAVDHSSDLSQVTDEGLEELLDRPLDPQRRRALLARLGHTPHPELVRLVVEDLAAKGSSGFGALRIHQELTLDQLHALRARRTELSTERAWVEAVMRRLRPPSSVDLELDRAAREAYLVELWKLVGPLPPANNAIKAHVLWHLLDAFRRRDAPPDLGLFIEYLKLPRAASFLPSKWTQRFRADQLVPMSVNLSATTGLPPAGDDEELVRDLVHRRLADVEQLSQWLDRNWLDAEIATAQLLGGSGDADRATLALGPSRAAALRDRIDLAWCLHNPARFGADEPIVLEADIKHVAELVVKVFRIDPLAYFQIHHREVSTDVDLDGLAASHQLEMRFAEPPIRRVRRRIELPMCTRPGTYVVDLIGNGRASRAVVHKGRLRHLVRVGAAGRVITILDENGRPRADARAWISDREYVCDERGTFVVPFSTSHGAKPMLMSCGDIATVSEIEPAWEEYTLHVDLTLDRQALIPGATVHAVARVRLSVADRPASLALLEQATWDVALTDQHGVATTKQYPLAPSDDEASVLEIPIDETTALVSIRVEGRVKVLSQQRDQTVRASVQINIAEIHRGTATEALYLAPTKRGWMLYALGKSGEPRAQRPITVSLVHRWSNLELNVELATDARGRCELGELPGIVRISAILSGVEQSWRFDDRDPPREGLVHATGDIAIPISVHRTAGELLRRTSLVELRGGVPARHVSPVIEPLAGAITIRGLPTGEYVLSAPGFRRAIRIASGSELAGNIVTASEIIEQSNPAPVIAELAATDVLAIRIANAGPSTRVHVIATHFVAAMVTSSGNPQRNPAYRVDRARSAIYVSGRDIGDEYRYVLERRTAKRFPSLQLAKPSLLLNPWARRVTTTDVATAAPGRAFAAAPPAPRPSPAAGPAQTRATAIDQEAYVAYDFLPEPPIVLPNLVPDERGAVVVPRAQLGRATCVTVIVDDPAGTTRRQLALDEQPLEPRDLRLGLALEPTRHATQRKAIAPLLPGETIVIDDIATAKVHVIDSIERAHAYLLALGHDDTLRELGFVTRWHVMPDAERREMYSKYACHELHLFLYHKDRPFFDAVVRPYLAHKRTKTFVDHWLLDADLAPYLEPAMLAQLNAVERALLAQRMTTEPAIARVLADEVNVQPPDPALDMRIIDALLGAATLDSPEGIGSVAEEAEGVAFAKADMLALPMAAPADEIAELAREPKQKRSRGGPAAFARDALDADLGRRSQQAPLYRVIDRTEEWAENNWWHRTPSESGADMIVPNRLWRDLALHRSGPFLSPWLGLATGSFAEAMCALAVVDLPFVASAHAVVADGPRLTITAAGNALAGSSQLVDGELVAGDPPLVVGQSYVRTDDRYQWLDGEQIDKYVDGPLIAGVVYTCTVVLANPTSSRQRIAALLQIPRGSIALGGARPTHTIDVVLEPYGTHGHEYSFYFPVAGTYTHFPVHVSRQGAIVAAATPRSLQVIAGGDMLDPHSWPHISQRGTLAEVIAFLDSQNLAEVELERAAWRLRDRAAFDAILGALERRRIFHSTLWGYALYHLDRSRIRAWARSLGAVLLEAGPVLDMPIVELDAERLYGYEHLELAPLINARAHRLGPKLRILNDGLAAQYQRFLELVAHRRRPTSEDLLAAAAYLFAQDRNDAALAMLARVDVAVIADRMQHDYVAAYAACVVGDLARARALLAPWRELPVDRWRHKFEAIAAMLAELEGAAPTIIDPKSREQQQAELAAKQPAFELAVDRDGVVIRQQHVDALELRFFEMDVELLFSRQPFVQSDVSRFSFIEPGHRETLTAPPPELRIPWPAALRGKNVVVELVGAGQRKAKIHYANDLATNLSHQYGQLRVQRASDRSPIAAAYIKIYAQKRGGEIAFYKDGYTDLRGWFDYASLSTSELDHVERFAILVASDQAGSAILEANPPAR